MRIISRLHICALAVCAASLLVPSAYAAPQFLLTPIPLLPQSTASMPTSVNNSGQVVGTGTIPSGQPTFFWSNGTLTSLGQFGILPSPAINNAGQVIGSLATAINGNGYYNGYFWANGTQSIIPAIGSGTLPTALDNTLSEAIAINSSGEIAGQAYNYTLPNTGFLPVSPIVWSNGQTTVIKPSSDYANNFNGGSATQINASGLVIGYFVLNSGSSQPFAWQNGVFTAIGSGPGAAVAVNDNGTVAGLSDGTAWTWNAGQFTDLPAISTSSSGKGEVDVTGINQNNWVIGEAHIFGANNNDSVAVAVLWHDGVAYQIPGIGHGPTGLSSAIATAINNNGQVIGRADEYDSNNNYLGQRGFFYDNGVTTYFEDPFPSTTANDATTADLLTQNGFVFGTYGSPNGPHAFFWDAADGMIPLDNLIAGGLDHSVWDHLATVTAISDNNLWITGTGVTVTGQTEGFLLELVPEPSSLLLLLIAGLPLLGRQLRKFPKA